MNTQSKPETPKKRYGLMRVRVESNHVLRIGGVRQQVRARDRSRFPDAKQVEWTCIWCRDHGGRGTFKTESELVASHPSRSVMTKQEEAHVYFAWCNDPEPSELEKLDDEIQEKLHAIETSGATKEDADRQTKALKEERSRRLAALPRVGMLTEDDET